MGDAGWLASLGGDAAEDEAGAGWLSSLPEAEGGGAQQPAGKAGQESPESEEEKPEDELVSMGFGREDVVTALKAAEGDLDEALVSLSQRAAKRARKGMKPEAAHTEGGFEVDGGVRCVLRDNGDVALLLPFAPEEAGPVVGKKSKSGIVFDGMDEWLWELYDSHRPRPAPLPPSFCPKAACTAFDQGNPYVWNDFANEAEILEANKVLEEMFTQKKLVRDSSAWINECQEGGYARNRKSLEGQKREDACGFWDLQGNDPAPPEPVLRLFRRLEAAGERLRAVNGWPLLCSRLGMGAVYDGQGARYTQHRDNEWQRHLRTRTRKRPPSTQRTGGDNVGAWMNFREVAMLAYINLPGQFGEDESGRQAGGRLRCHLDTQRGDLTGSSARGLLDVAPVGGRAVIFRAREMLHEVLPSFARRYCLVLWFQTCEDA